VCFRGVYGRKPSKNQKDHREALLASSKPIEKMAERRMVRPILRPTPAKAGEPCRTACDTSNRLGTGAGTGGHAEDDPESGLRSPLAARPAWPLQHRGRGWCAPPTSPTRTWFTNARVWCKLFTALIIMAGHRLCARALPLAAHDGLCSRELALPTRAPLSVWLKWRVLAGV
jgi:hypothetical protein